MPKHIRQTPVSSAATPLASGPGGLARWNAIAAVVALSASLMQPTDAQALALGRVIVQSALGEPLRAEIEVPEISADEAASLQVRIAPPEAHRALGVDLSAAMASTSFSLERRPDGRAYLKVTGLRPIQEPFMDLVLEAQWAAGSITRNYTMLFDPPNLRPAPIPLPPSTASSTAAPVASTVPAPAAQVRPVAPSAPAPAPAAATSEEVRVKPGDTAGRIAQAHKPANVSLDQMLVAMLRANPGAFIGGNVNRVRAGAILQMPDADTASAIPASEARQIIVSQSRDFNEFRRRLAAAAAPAAVAGADRQASGQIQTEVEDSTPAAAAQDKLTLTKPEAAAAEEQIVQTRQSQESATRQAELEKNIQDLSSAAAEAAAAATPAAAPAAPAEDAAAPAAESPAPAGVAVETESPALAPAEPPTAEAPAPAPAPAPAAKKKPAPPPPPVEEPSFFSSLLDNPLVLPGAGLLVALLAGFGFYRMRQRKQAAPVDSSFLESRLQPDSFFGTSGGQRIDTTEASVSGSSMVYSPSQLDAAGDVDPVAEADVYLAYGRDLQAEEILKEAMRSTPTRVAIHNKLMEIYAKRRDARAFEVVATEAYTLTQGQGPDWEHTCNLGRELDPDNPLYQPGGKPSAAAAAASAAAVAGSGNTMPFSSSSLGDTDGQLTANGVDLDLDLDLGLDSPAQAEATDAAVSNMDDLGLTDALTKEQAAPAGPVSRSMDFDLEFPSAPGELLSSAPADTPTFDPAESLGSLEDSLPIPLDDTPAPAPPSAAEPAPASDMLSFNLDEISLDLAPAAAPAPEAMNDPAPAGGSGQDGALETKLSLAEEFRAIGDIEGARSLAEEVLAEASGTLKTKASTFLADLA